MLNKELLLIPKESKNYTHILTLETNGDLLGYSISEGLGNITPKSFLDKTITAIWSRPDNFYSKVRVDAILGVSSLYLGRLDTKDFIEFYPIDEGFSEATGPSFFGSKDIGKTIPIWLATTPPPWA